MRHLEVSCQSSDWSRTNFKARWGCLGPHAVDLWLFQRMENSLSACVPVLVLNFKKNQNQQKQTKSRHPPTHMRFLFLFSTSEVTFDILCIGLGLWDKRGTTNWRRAAKVIRGLEHIKGNGRELGLFCPDKAGPWKIWLLPSVTQILC